MRIQVFAARGAVPGKSSLVDRIPVVLESLAKDTETHALVVAVYLLARRGLWQADTHTVMVTPSVFTRDSKRWDFVRRFGTPPGLPDRFQLVRMAFGMRASYPRTIMDTYDWQLRCEWFEDPLAYTFAHELHHYRRYHLDRHPGEGEQAACRWALERARAAGYRVEGTRTEPRKRRRRPPERVALPKGPNPDRLRRVKRAASRLSRDDLRDLSQWTRDRLAADRSAHAPTAEDFHVRTLRSLPPGAPLLIVNDEGGSRYVGQTAAKVRNLRRDSYRMAVRTPDGREWHWPMQWLKPAESGADAARQGRLFVAE